jgi:hypothetical protein
VFEDIEALPGAQHHAAVLERDRQLGLGQRRADMGRHVVRSLVGMAIERVALRHQPAEIGDQVALHIRIGIFLNDQRGGGMAAEHGEKPVAQAGRAQPADDPVGDVGQVAAAGLDGQSGLSLSHGRA